MHKNKRRGGRGWNSTEKNLVRFRKILLLLPLLLLLLSSLFLPDSLGWVNQYYYLYPYPCSYYYHHLWEKERVSKIDLDMQRVFGFCNCFFSFFGGCLLNVFLGSYCDLDCWISGKGVYGTWIRNLFCFF